MRRLQAVVGYLLLGCMVLPTTLQAAEKQYPVEGTVIALGARQEASWGFHHRFRTYNVKTPTRIFILKCPHDMDHLFGKRECGGKKPIETGDTLHLRVEKRYAYVQTDEGKEQRLAVLSERVNEAGAPEAAKQP